ncbi:hypothetical protein FKP32DRAFT_1224033 [Trametes sanguinea]|nr:hypothetical protein FKP32DRAFT_1224033 [Trametes sanguinea]
MPDRRRNSNVCNPDVSRLADMFSHEDISGRHRCDTCHTCRLSCPSKPGDSCEFVLAPISFARRNVDEPLTERHHRTRQPIISIQGDPSLDKVRLGICLGRMPYSGGEYSHFVIDDHSIVLPSIAAASYAAPSRAPPSTSDIAFIPTGFAEVIRPHLSTMHGPKRFEARTI